MKIKRRLVQVKGGRFCLAVLQCRNDFFFCKPSKIFVVFLVVFLIDNENSARYTVKKGLDIFKKLWGLI